MGPGAKKRVALLLKLAEVRARQAVTAAGAMDYAAAPHSMLSMHGNKVLTLDLTRAREMTGWPTMSFRAAACYAGTADPRAGVSVYVDGRSVVPRTILGRGPLPIEVALAGTDRFLTLMVQEHKLAGRIAALGPLPAATPPEKTLAEMTIDASSVRGPKPDASVRPDGMLLTAAAWSAGRDRALAPDLKLVLTEYPDPGGEATYFHVSDDAACVDDELLAKPEWEKETGRDVEGKSKGDRRR